MTILTMNEPRKRSPSIFAGGDEEKHTSMPIAGSEETKFEVTAASALPGNQQPKSKEPVLGTYVRGDFRSFECGQLA